MPQGCKSYFSVFIEAISLLLSIAAIAVSCVSIQSSRQIAEKQMEQERDLVYLESRLSEMASDRESWKSFFKVLYSSVEEIIQAIPPTAPDFIEHKEEYYLSDKFIEQVKQLNERIDEFIYVINTNIDDVPIILDIDCTLIQGSMLLIKKCDNLLYSSDILNKYHSGETPSKTDEVIDLYEQALLGLSDTLVRVKRDIKDEYNNL